MPRRRPARFARCAAPPPWPDIARGRLRSDGESGPRRPARRTTRRTRQIDRLPRRAAAANGPGGRGCRRRSPECRASGRPAVSAGRRRPVPCAPAPRANRGCSTAPSQSAHAARGRDKARRRQHPQANSSWRRRIARPWADSNRDADNSAPVCSRPTAPSRAPFPPATPSACSAAS